MQGTIPMPIRVISSMLNHEFQPAGVAGHSGAGYVTARNSPAAKLKLHHAGGNTNKAANKATRAAIVGHIHMQE
jgi:hypothetical protein